LNEALKNAKYEIARLQSEHNKQKDSHKRDVDKLQDIIKENEKQMKIQDDRISNLIYQLNYKKEEENNVVDTTPKEIKVKTTVQTQGSNGKVKNLKGKIFNY